MIVNPALIIPVSAAAIYGALLVLVILAKPRSRLRIIFSVYLMTMFVWSISAFLTLSNIVGVVLWFRVMSAAAFAMMAAIFYVVQALFGLRRRLAQFVLYFSFFSISLTLFSSYVIKTAHINDMGELQYEFGSIFYFIAVLSYSFLILSIVELIRGYNRTKDFTQRNRIRYLIIGLSITILASLINFTPLGKYPLDIAANGITAILIAYAILRHQLLDIRIVARMGLFYSITTAIFSALYFLIISLAIGIFQAVTGRGVILLSVVVASVTAILLSPLRNFAQTWIDRLFYREKYNAGLMLQRLSQTTASLLDLNKISEMILAEVTQTLHIAYATIFLKQNPDGHFHAIAHQGKAQENLLDFRQDHPIVLWMSRHNRILTSEEINIMPLFKSLWGEERAALDNLQAQLFIPLNAKGEVVGFLVVGPKLSLQPYHQDDMLALSTLANQTAVAIENARLYEDLEDTFIQTIITLANAIDMRDTYTSGHSQRIAGWASETAMKMNCDPEEVRAIYWGGLLHDIGKIGIPDSILKKPAKLTKSEWEIIRTHPEMGARLISPIKKLTHIAPLIGFSHERYDGSGYPNGLKGEQIPIGAHIIAVVDSFSAMIDERPYKKPINYSDAIEELRRNAGKLFDPKVVDAFLLMISTNGSVPNKVRRSKSHGRPAGGI